MSPQPPWKRPGGEPEGRPAEPQPQPAEQQAPPPEPPAPIEQLPPPAEPAPPAEQLPPPAEPPAPDGGRRNLAVLGGGAVAAVVIAVVLVVLLAGGDDDPEPERAAATATATPAAAGTPASTEAPAPTTAPASLRGLIADTVGPWRAKGISRGDALLEEGASEAFGVDYEAPGGKTLTHNLGAMASPDAAEARRLKLIKDRKKYGARVVVEQPYAIDDSEVGTLTVVNEGGLWLAIWTNGNVYCTALTGSERELEDFVNAVPY